MGTTTDDNDATDEVGPNPAHLQDQTAEADLDINVIRKRQQLRVPATPPSFDAAIAYLGLKVDDRSQAIPHPPNTFQVSPTFLKPWQVTGVAWMLEQEASPLYGGILADACGLGKTLTALTLVWAANQLQEPLDHSRTFAPTLVLVPNALVDTWITEIDRRRCTNANHLFWFQRPDRGPLPKITHSQQARGPPGGHQEARFQRRRNKDDGDTLVLPDVGPPDYP